jgi:sugar phosphate isomerase/epimerase
MRITDAARPAYLTYCTNVHPADDLSSLATVLDTTTANVARTVARGRDFGLGLRLGAEQARELMGNPASRARFEEVLARHRFFVFTINGFPQARFHETRVKDAVYRPNWTDPARLAYTLDLASLLASWLPKDDRFGTISTVPIGWRADLPDGVAVAAARLWALVAGLARIEREQGARIMVCLEPEPGCAIETIPELIAFVQAMLAGERPEDDVRGARGDELLLRHLGVCYDACHQAVLFQDPESDLTALAARGIAVGKVQISNALRLRFSGADDLAALTDCAEGRFLHQVAVRSPGRKDDLRFDDLPDLDAARPGGDFGRGGEARCHFHVPVYAEAFPPLETTRDELIRTLGAALRLSRARHFEVETYTFHVLPERLRDAPLETHLGKEIEFSRSALDSAAGSPVSRNRLT